MEFKGAASDLALQLLVNACNIVLIAEKALQAHMHHPDSMLRQC
jgi:hypothetical protein